MCVSVYIYVGPLTYKIPDMDEIYPSALHSCASQHFLWSRSKYLRLKKGGENHVIIYIQNRKKNTLLLTKKIPFCFSCVFQNVSCTRWRRLIGSPKLQIMFHKRATKHRSLLRKIMYKDKGSYVSSPPCSLCHTSYVWK